MTAATIMFLLYGVAGSVGFLLIDRATTQRHHDECTLAAESRDGLRGVLLFALNRSSNPSGIGATAFRKYMDENLPPFTCSKTGHRILVPDTSPRRTP